MAQAAPQGQLKSAGAWSLDEDDEVVGTAMAALPAATGPKTTKTSLWGKQPGHGKDDFFSEPKAKAKCKAKAKAKAKTKVIKTAVKSAAKKKDAAKATTSGSTSEEGPELASEPAASSRPAAKAKAKSKAKAKAKSKPAAKAKTASKPKAKSSPAKAKSKASNARPGNLKIYPTRPGYRGCSKPLRLGNANAIMAMEPVVLLPPADTGLDLEPPKKVPVRSKHPTLAPLKIQKKRKAGPANLTTKAEIESSDVLPSAVDDDETFLELGLKTEDPETKVERDKQWPKATAKKEDALRESCGHFANGHRWAPFSGCVCKTQHSYTGDAVMEVFCPPRLVAEAQARGLKAGISLDKETGWNANEASAKRHARALLQKHRPWLLLVSPECRMYSIMQRNCNQKKMDPQVWEEQLMEADDRVDFSMELCIAQGKAQRKFVFEHPSGAASWRKDTVQRVMDEAPDTHIISFAQCRFGLRAPNGQPLQKLTKFLTNSRAVIQTFGSCQCVCTPLGLTHAKIEGSMDGQKMSRWAQKYPPGLVSALVDCCQREMP
eukprot:Skav200282  [mRNA]  locus=scaffold718:189054:191152:- [translate_table: standard]